MGLFIEQPLLALMPAVVFFGFYRASRRRVTLVAAVVWVAYAAYELAMRRRWLCSGECNIRVDLLLIYPMLAVMSLIGLVAASRGRRPAGPD